mgnify:CR=1 FL=1
MMVELINLDSLSRIGMQQSIDEISSFATNAVLTIWGVWGYLQRIEDMPADTVENTVLRVLWSRLLVLLGLDIHIHIGRILKVLGLPSNITTRS